jgi:hypothetical protein
LCASAFARTLVGSRKLTDAFRALLWPQVQPATQSSAEVNAWREGMRAAIATVA